MKVPQVVLDTNVLVSGLRSRRGASNRLLGLVGKGLFEINLSVALVLEYEAVLKRLVTELPYSLGEIDEFMAYLCEVGQPRRIYYHWRPMLSDANDEFVLELAVAAQCQYLVTFNRAHYRGAEQFGIHVVTPREFLQEIGELS